MEERERERERERKQKQMNCVSITCNGEGSKKKKTRNHVILKFFVFLPQFHASNCTTQQVEQQSKQAKHVSLIFFSSLFQVLLHHCSFSLVFYYCL